MLSGMSRIAAILTAMESHLATSSILIAIALTAALLAGIAALVRWASVPAEITGIVVVPGQPAELTLAAPRSGKLRVWGRYEIGTDDEDAIVTVEYEVRSGDRVVASGTTARGGVRIWHGGRADWEAFTDPIASIADLTPGAPVHVRMNVVGAIPSAPILSARVFATR
jgi:hypothetical protein